MQRMSWKKRNREKRMDRGRLKTGGILAAFIAAVMVFTVMVQTEKRILTQYEKGVVYTAARAIPRGTLITEENWKSYFREQELDKTCIPDAALTNAAQAEGLAAVYDIDCGTLLTDGMFEPVNLILEGMREPVIAGLKAEDIFQVAGGILRSGDRIHIYSVGEDGTVLVWPGIYVQQVFDAAGNSIGNEDRTTAAQRINVYLDREEIPEFYAALDKGLLRAVKVVK